VKNAYIISVIMFFFISCSVEEAYIEFESGNEAACEYPGYFILAGNSRHTKVAYSDDAVSSFFQADDLVGVFALDKDMNPLADRPQNACHKVVVTDETDLETGEKIRILEKNSEADDIGRGAAYYLFYYPYNEEIVSLEELKDLDHAVSLEQTSREAFQSSDLLWDITSPAQDISGTAEYVWVKMDHAMAQVIIEIDSDIMVPGTLPELIGVRNQAENINLLADGIDAIDYEVSGSLTDLTAWEFGFSTSRDYLFRVALPAYQTLGTKMPVLRFSGFDETMQEVSKLFRLNSPVSLLPGRTYYLKATSTAIHTPDEGEEDSWVLDVRHPITHQPVGLLCREYIRYQPDHTGDANLKMVDVLTGNPTPDGESRYISSQVWVFYGFHENTTLPDLNVGTAMRFVYDIRSAFNNAYSEGTVPSWPDPHRYGTNSKVAQGLFAADHGHTWVYSPTGDYGMSSEDEVEHYMHGGRIIWDGTNDVIEEFQMPVDPEGNPLEITNAWAYDHGHIAITPEGKVFVSFAQIIEDTNKDVEGNYIGILSPHYLIDRRVGISKEAQERAYPLVKIGYNQFWMSKSLRATTLSDGTPLICYNNENAPGVRFMQYHENGAEVLEPGYLLPIKNTVDSPKGTFDPYNQLTPEQREENEISLLYNTKAFYSGKILPKSSDSRTYYIMPGKENVEKMMLYCGWCFAAKMMTDGCRTRINNGDTYGEDEWDALVAGKFSHVNYNLYAPNISGLNLKSHGMYQSGIGYTQAGTKCSMLLYPDDPETEAIVMNFNPWNVFSTDSFANLYLEMSPVEWRRQEYLSRNFAPVRFIMKFKGQDDSEPMINVTSQTKSISTPPLSASLESRDIYLGIEPVEHSIYL
jgi:hypothetical protein